MLDEIGGLECYLRVCRGKGSDHEGETTPARQCGIVVSLILPSDE